MLVLILILQNVKGGGTNPSYLYLCTGNTPGNSELVAGDDQGLTANVVKRLVASDTSRKCEYVCKSGYEYKNGSCKKLAYSCTGNTPGNAILIPGDDEGLTVNTPRKLVAKDTPARCEYVCKSGYEYKNGSCKRACELGYKRLSNDACGKLPVCNDNSHYKIREVNGEWKCLLIGDCLAQGLGRFYDQYSVFSNERPIGGSYPWTYVPRESFNPKKACTFTCKQDRVGAHYYWYRPGPWCGRSRCKRGTDYPNKGAGDSAEIFFNPTGSDEVEWTWVSSRGELEEKRRKKAEGCFAFCPFGKMLLSGSNNEYICQKKYCVVGDQGDGARGNTTVSVNKPTRAGELWKYAPYKEILEKQEGCYYSCNEPRFQKVPGMYDCSIVCNEDELQNGLYYCRKKCPNVNHYYDKITGQCKNYCKDSESYLPKEKLCKSNISKLSCGSGEKLSSEGICLSCIIGSYWKYPMDMQNYECVKG